MYKFSGILEYVKICLNCRYFDLQKYIVALWARKLCSYPCFLPPTISIYCVSPRVIHGNNLSFFLTLIIAHLPLPFFGIFISIKHSVLSTHIHYWNLMSSFAIRTVSATSSHTNDYCDGQTPSTSVHVFNLTLSLWNYWSKYSSLFLNLKAADCDNWFCNQVFQMIIAGFLFLRRYI